MFNKKIFILIAAAIFVLVLLLVFKSFNKSSVISPSAKPNNLSTLAPTNPATSLEVLKTDAAQEILAAQPIVVTFNKPVRLESLVFSAQPNIRVIPKYSGQTSVITLEPETQIWQFDTDYTILINSAVSVDGTSLQKPYEIKFHVLPRGGI